MTIVRVAFLIIESVLLLRLAYWLWKLDRLRREKTDEK